MFYYSDDLHKPLEIQYFVCSFTASTGTIPYSSILMTFVNVLEIQHCSCMHLLLDGFGSRGSIDNYSHDLHEPILNPIFVYITLLPDGFGGHSPCSIILATFTNLSVLEIKRCSYMNLLPDSFGGHSENLHKHIRNPILFLCELAPGRLWQPLVPDSTILTTFADLLGIQQFDFMNLLADGFGRLGPILYSSGDLHKPIRNPTLVLYQSAPRQLWRRGPILHYSDDLRRSIRKPKPFLFLYVAVFVFPLSVGRDGALSKSKHVDKSTC